MITVYYLAQLDQPLSFVTGIGFTGGLLALLVRPRGRAPPVGGQPDGGVRGGGAGDLYAVTTGHDATDVLLSGQSAIGPLLQNSASWTTSPDAATT